MLSMLKKYKVAICIALLLTLFELFVELIQPFIISKIIDHGIIAGDVSAIYTWGSILLGCTVAAFAGGIINSFYSSHVSQSYGFDLRERLYEKVQSFSFAVFNRIPASSYITRLTNDVAQIQSTVFMALRIALRAPLLVIGAVGMAFLVNPRLAVYLLISVPVLFVFLIWVLRKAGFLFGNVQERLDDVNAIMQENLIAIRLVRAFNRMSQQKERFNAASLGLSERTRAALRLSETTTPGILFLMNLGVMAVLWFGQKQIASGGTSVGDVVAIVNYATRMIAALSIMSWIIMAYSRAKASSKRIMDVLRTDAGIADDSRTRHEIQITEGSIEYKEVSFRYPDSLADELQGLDFKVEAGATIAIMGATGSGKSTLFQFIPRLYEVSGGTVRIDGYEMDTIEIEHLRDQIGYVPQEALLFTGTIRENIAWGKEAAGLEEIMEAAKDAQIHDAVMKLPNGYDTIVGQRGINLSGGQKQRLSIARALVKKPRILLLDDCTSALDAKTEAKLLQALRKYRCTTLMITQKISSAIQADQILLLQDGKLLDKGSHAVLMQRSALYRQIFQSQFGKEATGHAQSAH